MKKMNEKLQKKLKMVGGVVCIGIGITGVFLAGYHIGKTVEFNAIVDGLKQMKNERPDLAGLMNETVRHIDSVTT